MEKRECKKCKTKSNFPIPVVNVEDCVIEVNSGVNEDVEDGTVDVASELDITIVDVVDSKELENKEESALDRSLLDGVVNTLDVSNTDEDKLTVLEGIIELITEESVTSILVDGNTEDDITSDEESVIVEATSLVNETLMDEELDVKSDEDTIIEVVGTTDVDSGFSDVVGRIEDSVPKVDDVKSLDVDCTCDENMDVEGETSTEDDSGTLEVISEDIVTEVD